MSMSSGLLLLVVVAILTGFGQICFKKVAVRNGSLWQKATNPLFVLGVVLFVICPILSSLAASVIEYTILYGMTSLNYLVVLGLSRLIMKESLDVFKVSGVAVIVVGLLVMLSG